MIRDVFKRVFEEMENPDCVSLFLEACNKQWPPKNLPHKIQFEDGKLKVFIASGGKYRKFALEGEHELRNWKKLIKDIKEKMKKR